MAKFGQVEINREDWQGVKELLNSKIGMAVIVSLLAFGIFTFIVPHLESIDKHTAVMAESLQDAKNTNEANHVLLVRMMEQCDFTTRRKEPGK